MLAEPSWISKLGTFGQVRGMFGDPLLATTPAATAAATAPTATAVAMPADPSPAPPDATAAVEPMVCPPLAAELAALLAALTAICCITAVLRGRNKHQRLKLYDPQRRAIKKATLTG